MILIFETHPIQYKAPLYQRLQQLRPDSFKVIYGTDSSMRDGFDREFGRKVTWDVPLLEGYPNEILHNDKGPIPLQGFGSLTGRGILKVLRKERPYAVLIAPFLFQFDATAFLYSVLLRIPIWTRTETQDEAFVRTKWRNDIRNAFYWVAYKFVSHAFYISALGREHLYVHGVAPEKASFAPYATPLNFPAETSEKQRLRDELRGRLHIPADDTMILFSGKLIDKKNPGLILAALAQLPAEVLKKMHVVYVGSGELEPTLREEAKKYPGQIQFAGFINQSEMASYYLAADILILPSRRMGETWGLVVNEALKAGCGVIVSSAVGCSRDFGHTERVRVIPDGSANACTQAIMGLARLPRSFDWSTGLIAPYTLETAAQALAAQIDKVSAGKPAS
jgi:glycosyltransferase involved in cell wall biosynthesis